MTDTQMKRLWVGEGNLGIEVSKMQAREGMEMRIT